MIKVNLIKSFNTETITLYSGKDLYEYRPYSLTPMGDGLYTDAKVETRLLPIAEICKKIREYDDGTPFKKIRKYDDGTPFESIEPTCQYYVYSPEIEEAIGVPMNAIIESRNMYKALYEDKITAITECHFTIREMRYANFWTRLKFLFRGERMKWRL